MRIKSLYVVVQIHHLEVIAADTPQMCIHETHNYVYYAESTVNAEQFLITARLHSSL